MNEQQTRRVTDPGKDECMPVIVAISFNMLRTHTDQHEPTEQQPMNLFFKASVKHIENIISDQALEASPMEPICCDVVDRCVDLLSGAFHVVALNP